MFKNHLIFLKICKNLHKMLDFVVFFVKIPQLLGVYLTKSGFLAGQRYMIETTEFSRLYRGIQSLIWPAIQGKIELNIMRYSGE